MQPEALKVAYASVGFGTNWFRYRYTLNFDFLEKIYLFNLPISFELEENL